MEGLSGDGGNITITGRSLDSVSGDPVDTSENQIDFPDDGSAIDDNPADVIALDGGFIQANTAAENARGGDIRINTRSVIAQRDKLFVGGEERIEFEPGKGINVIQAAAPGGEQGDINFIVPELDISGALHRVQGLKALPHQARSGTLRAWVTAWIPPWGSAKA